MAGAHKAEKVMEAQPEPSPPAEFRSQQKGEAGPYDQPGDGHNPPEIHGRGLTRWEG